MTLPCPCALATWLLAGLAALALLPSVVLALEIVAALPRRRAHTVSPAPTVRMAILVPAHDEEAQIGAAVVALRGELQPGDRLIVIADNCKDETAARAREAGAEVIVRDEADRRGKGFAISFGVAHLKADPPEGVVLVDADCRIAGGKLAELARAARATGVAVQADYVLAAPMTANKLACVNAFAVLVRNRVRPLGLDRLVGACQLTGSGMAFPWPVLRDAPAMRENLVEDLALGLELALRGIPPRLQPEVRVQSELPSSGKAGRGQRRRWEHGQLHTMKRYTPRLIAAFLRRPRLALLGLALDLLVPPLALLVLLQFSILAITALTALTGITSTTPLLIAATSFALLLFAIGLAWLFFGRETLTLAAAARIPFYVLWKLGLYVSLLVRGKQRTWERTERQPPSEGPSSP
jgi:cellulose synthase/poly-beta-1,6-N-acetylglucosamine synthase-like glycosyltransferase